MQEKFSGEVIDSPELNAPIVRLAYNAEDPERNLIAEVAPFYGSNLYRYRVGEHELIHCDTGLLKDRDWTGTFVLWPIPNRVRGKQYEFEGHVQSLERIKRKHGNETLIHGFVDDVAWEHDEPVADDKGAKVATWIDITEDSPMFEHYPYKSRLTLTYLLTAAGLRIEYLVENKDDKNMPFGFALHPFFSTLSALDKTFVTVPADYIMEADDELLPSGNLIPMGSEGYDLRNPTPLSELVVDHVYTGLREPSDATIDYLDQGLRLTLSASPDFTHLVVFTSESHKGFICLENQTGSTDMINLHARSQKEADEALAAAAHLMILSPGDAHRGHIEYRADGIK